MLSSMTGFSRVTLPESKAIGVIELRSLNHKQLDINLKISEKARFFEEKARIMLKRSSIGISIPVNNNFVTTFDWKI